MKVARTVVTLLCLLVMGVFTLSAQMIKRTDAIWARTAPGPITIDGVLNEPSWAAAESVRVAYGQSAGIPGSGWFHEQGAYPSDRTNATVKFLVHGDSLYVAVIARDSSVGGGPFNRFDGVLSNVRYKQPTGFLGTPDRDWNTHKAFEIFYAWVKEGWADSLADAPGRLPFFGGFAGSSPYEPRPDSLRRIWDAATTVQGTQNGDGDVDQSYTMEFKINLRILDYDVTRPDGDIVMYNISIYDADWQWPLDTARFSGNRVWLQGPWGNATHYNHLRIFTKPSVTTTSPLPTIGPDVAVPNGQAYASPAMDGRLSESVWRDAPSFKIQYGNGSLRNSYPNTGPYRSGQFQPEVNGVRAPVLDPNEATVKYFFKGDTLFLGFDVNDIVVQYHPDLNRRDGFRVTINDRARVRGDSSLFCWQLQFFVDSTGGVGIGEDTPFLRDSIQAVRLALALKPGTTVDTLGQAADSGYTAEVAINLNKLGYPTGRGDGIVFLGLSYFDGDSFTPATGSYATRTWWFRDAESFNFSDGPAWCYLDPNLLVTVEETADGIARTFELLGNYPNPFNPSTIVRYTVAEAGTVTMLVFDVLGRKVASLDGGFQTPGVRQLEFNAGHLSSGTYFYYLQMVGASSKNVLRTTTGKMMFVK